MGITIRIPRPLVDLLASIVEQERKKCGEDIGLPGIDGIITVRAWPDFLNHEDTGDPEYSKWRASLTPLEWDRYLVPLKVNGREQDYAHNLLTNDGINTVLQNMTHATQANLAPFTEVFSIGNGAIAAVARTDTAVAGDGFTTGARHVPNPIIYSGNQSDTPCALASTDAVGTWTNIGIYGWKYSNSTDATTTAGTGSLKTHSLFSYVKGASAVTVDYLFVLNN